MSGGSQHNPNGRQSQLGPGWSPLQLQVANLLARAPQAHMASERGVTWHTPTPPPHLYHVPAPSPPDPLQAMKSAGNSVFRHTATPPEIYRHTPTPPEKHLLRHTPSPGDVKGGAALPPTDLYPHLGPGRGLKQEKLRAEELLAYARGGVDLTLGGPRGANGSPAAPAPAPPAPPAPPALSVRDAPTINSLIARAAPHARPAHARVDALLERLAAAPAPASPHSVIVHSRAAPTPSPPSSNEVLVRTATFLLRLRGLVRSTAGLQAETKAGAYDTRPGARAPSPRGHTLPAGARAAARRRERRRGAHPARAAARAAARPSPRPRASCRAARAARPQRPAAAAHSPLPARPRTPRQEKNALQLRGDHRRHRRHDSQPRAGGRAAARARARARARDGDGRQAEERPREPRARAHVSRGATRREVDHKAGGGARAGPAARGRGRAEAAERAHLQRRVDQCAGGVALGGEAGGARGGGGPQRGAHRRQLRRGGEPAGEDVRRPRGGAPGGGRGGHQEGRQAEEPEKIGAVEGAAQEASEAGAARAHHGGGRAAARQDAAAEEVPAEAEGRQEEVGSGQDQEVQRAAQGRLRLGQQRELQQVAGAVHTDRRSARVAGVGVRGERGRRGGAARRGVARPQRAARARPARQHAGAALRRDHAGRHVAVRLLRRRPAPPGPRRPVRPLQRRDRLRRVQGAGRGVAAAVRGAVGRRGGVAARGVRRVGAGAGGGGRAPVGARRRRVGGARLPLRALQPPGCVSGVRGEGVSRARASAVRRARAMGAARGLPRAVSAPCLASRPRRSGGTRAARVSPAGSAPRTPRGPAPPGLHHLPLGRIEPTSDHSDRDIDVVNS